MIRSMTGYGAATAETPHGQASVEARTVNNRFLDASVRVPSEFSALEPAVRDLAKRRLRRGKLDLVVRYFPAEGKQAAATLNGEVLHAYLTQLREILSGDELLRGLDVTRLLSLPGVMTSPRQQSSNEDVEATILAAAEEALAALDVSRASEGRALVVDLRNHVTTLETLRHEIAGHAPALVEDFRQRLAERAADLTRKAAVTIEPGRLEQEVAMFAERSDITEELVRLEAHTAAFRALCDDESDEPVGKRMEFLVQEILREVTTLGNKCRGVEISPRVIELKHCVEKIREQVANLE